MPAVTAFSSSSDPRISFGKSAWPAGYLAVVSPASSALTRELMGWQPTHPGLIEDLEKGHYFHNQQDH